MISQPSVQSLFLEAMANGEVLGTGTGFVVEHGNRPYLITNYHVVAGRSPIDGQPRHRSGAVPDKLRVSYLLPPMPGRLFWEERYETVLDVEEDRALWLEHPTHGRLVDVVAVPLANSAGTELRPYDLLGGAPEIMVGPSDGVSIVGFPFGITGGGRFAIWTRGFIASERDVDFHDLPRFLIDARTRPGQSGSPVIAYSAGGMTSMADRSTAIFDGPVTNLLGIYSGRINEQSDLGIVWKVRAIKEILAAQKPGVAGL
ncbi:S1-C subfamily serine protease [Micromonospora vinacea]|uniref:S1-C subfamily serine protease n=1 Tax=Micromonospora vinacea TaxID=709878 RepID=A0ABS0JUY2_9ACTN|nr:serine protease [Micromonospora vinacea]MBG6100173.1 S1-C subfamily serine protease [Micromonospora vinacea]